MARRKKLKSNWPPAGWEISYEYELCGTTVKSRGFDIQVQTSARTKTWWLFDYHCLNTNNGKSWISGFDSSGFAACRVDQVVAVRLHREKKKSNAETPRESPIKKPRKRRSDAGKKRGPRTTKAA